MGVEEQFTYSMDEGVGIITLNRPERMNAVNWDLCKADFGQAPRIAHR